MTALIVTLILNHASAPLDVRYTPVQIYASALMCDEQVRSTANREAATHPGAIVRVACVPVVPGE